MVTAWYSDSNEREDAYRLLEHAFRERFGLPCPEIRKTTEGKPCFPSLPGVHFSLSHTRGRVMVCFADAPCGCDVQELRPVRDSAVRYACGEEELRDFGFFELWAMKESFIKLRGRPIPWRHMVFRRENGGVRAPDPSVQARLYPAPGFMSAVCALEPPPESLIFVPAGVLTGRGQNFS